MGEGIEASASLTISQSRLVTETISSQQDSDAWSPQQSVSHTSSTIPWHACTSTGVAVTETMKDTVSTASSMVWINFKLFSGFG